MKCDYEGCKKQGIKFALFNILNPNDREEIPTGEQIKLWVCDEHVKFSIDNEPIFCATCGRQIDSEKFCSKECSEYEDLE